MTTPTDSYSTNHTAQYADYKNPVPAPRRKNENEKVLPVAIEAFSKAKKKKSFVAKVVTSPCAFVKAIANFFLKIFSRKEQKQITIQYKNECPDQKVVRENENQILVHPAAYQYIQRLKNENIELKQQKDLLESTLETQYNIRRSERV